MHGLTKRYGPLTALNHLNLNVVQGEVFGFLGLNGAGKTTAIRLLLDLLRPTSGKAFIFGHDCWADGLAARARVGYLPGELGLYPDLTASKFSISSPASTTRRWTNVVAGNCLTDWSCRSATCVASGANTAPA